MSAAEQEQQCSMPRSSRGVAGIRAQQTRKKQFLFLASKLDRTLVVFAWDGNQITSTSTSRQQQPCPKRPEKATGSAALIARLPFFPATGQPGNDTIVEP